MSDSQGWGVGPAGFAGAAGAAGLAAAAGGAAGGAAGLAAGVSGFAAGVSAGLSGGVVPWSLGVVSSAMDPCTVLTVPLGLTTFCSKVVSLAERAPVTSKCDYHHSTRVLVLFITSCRPVVPAPAALPRGRGSVPRPPCGGRGSGSGPFRPSTRYRCRQRKSPC